jgi:mannose-6-phosphate isomerase-like protein (cupin superfamily)
MKRNVLLFGVPVACVLSFAAGVVVSSERSGAQPSAIISRAEAKREDFAWGSLYTYYAGESYGTKDGLTAVAVIKPGQEIHPPHEHAEEEYLMVVEGSGTWHLNGKDSPAKAGDIQYSAPWDVHGIKNTGSTPLTFVVWKWNNKGVAVPAKGT